MSQLTSLAFERSIRYVLPFSKCTKAEMINSLGSHGLGEWLQLSQSCVHTSLRERNLRHCGQCPACIERRQAFAAAGISEKIDRNYKVDLLREPILTPGNADYLLRYLDDARSWIGHGDSVRQRLAWHLSGTNIDDDQFNSIARRQRRHSKEVIRTLGHLTVQRTEEHVTSSRNDCGTLFEEVMT